MGSQLNAFTEKHAKPPTTNTERQWLAVAERARRAAHEMRQWGLSISPATHPDEVAIQKLLKPPDSPNKAPPSPRRLLKAEVGLQRVDDVEANKSANAQEGYHHARISASYLSSSIGTDEIRNDKKSSYRERCSSLPLTALAQTPVLQENLSEAFPLSRTAHSACIGKSLDFAATMQGSIAQEVDAVAKRLSCMLSLPRRPEDTNSIARDSRTTEAMTTSPTLDTLGGACISSNHVHNASISEWCSNLFDGEAKKPDETTLTTSTDHQSEEEADLSQRTADDSLLLLQTPTSCGVDNKVTANQRPQRAAGDDNSAEQHKNIEQTTRLMKKATPTEATTHRGGDMCTTVGPIERRTNISLPESSSRTLKSHLLKPGETRRG